MKKAKKYKQELDIEPIPWDDEPGGMLFGEVSPDDYTEPEESAEEINERISRITSVDKLWQLIVHTGGVYRFDPVEEDDPCGTFEAFPLGSTSEELLLKVTKGNNMFERGHTVGVDMEQLCFELKVTKV